VESKSDPTGDAPGGLDTDAEPPWSAAVERRESMVPTALHGQRLDKAVVAMADEFSRNHLQGLIEQGHVRVDGVVVGTASRKVLAGQSIAVELVPTAESRAFRPEALALTVVFEDAHLLVVDKAAGMVVHPAAGNWSGTLLNALLAHHRAAASLPRAAEDSLFHLRRLDPGSLQRGFRRDHAHVGCGQGSHSAAKLPDWCPHRRQNIDSLQARTSKPSSLPRQRMILARPALTNLQERGWARPGSFR